MHPTTLDDPADPPAPLRRGRADARRPGSPLAGSWLVTGLLSVGVVAAMTHLAEIRLQERALPPPAKSAAAALAVPAARTIAPPAGWRSLAAAAPRFVFDGEPPPAAEARMRADGSREDLVTRGRFGDAGYAHLRIRRGGEDGGASFFVDLVRQAAAAGLAVVRSGGVERLATKFGVAETASVVLSGSSDTACQAVRIARADIAFSLQGWLCAAPGPATGTDLACLVDALAFVGGDDAALKTVFAAAGRRRGGGCAPRLAGLRGS